jgi:hypothetical protein
VPARAENGQGRRLIFERRHLRREHEDERDDGAHDQDGCRERDRDEAARGEVRQAQRQQATHERGQDEEARPRHG